MKRSTFAIIILPLLGCGSVAELLGVVVTDAGSGDASPDAGVLADGSTDEASEGSHAGLIEAARADVSSVTDAGLVDREAGFLMTPFGPPAIVSALADIDADNEDPSMTGDSLELYFMSTRSGVADIWQSRRASPDAGWGPPQQVTELNADAGQGAPGVSLDGLTLWFSRQSQTWVTYRANRSQPWNAPTPVAELNPYGAQLDPAVDESSLLMFIAVNLDAGWDLYSSLRSALASTWGPLVLVPGLNTSFDELDPFVASYGLQVWFESSRTGGGDLFWAYRASTSDPFGTPVPLDSLNTSSKESDPTLSADFRYILFASTRGGLPQIYEAYR